MKREKNIFIFVALLFCVLLFPAGKVKADESLLPTAWDNRTVGLHKTSEDTWGLQRTSDLVSLDDGYMRVFCKEETVYVEYYDNAFQIRSKRTIPMELSRWGGFYSGSDSYYLVEGQDNEEEDDTKEVIRVIRYDKNWNRLGAAKITSGSSFASKVCYPFDHGCVEMTEIDGTLYIATAHEGYIDTRYGVHHQGFLMVAVEESTMKGQIVDSDLWHSFSQYVKSKGKDLYLLEQSEGSQCMVLSHYDTTGSGKEKIVLYSYGGDRDSIQSVPCYASVDGMALSADHILCLGASIDQSRYAEAKQEELPMNIFLTVTPMDDFTTEATKVVPLTAYTEKAKSFLGLKITKVNDNRFMVSWEEYEKEEGQAGEEDSLSGSVLHYLFVDGKGNKISKEYTINASISDCQPVVKDEKIVYYASNSNMVNFYSIDSATGNTSKKMYRVAGEQASWDFKGGTLTVKGRGALSVAANDIHRIPYDTTVGSFTWVSWERGAWNSIRNQVKKLVICSGITVIPEHAFSYFENLEEVEIESGLTSIEKEAFYRCEELKKIEIPFTVTKIGENILWTGWTNALTGEPISDATIYAPYNSYAIQYAKKNKIKYQIDLSAASVSGLGKSYPYTGSAVTPKVTVKLGGQVLEEGNDYVLSYSENEKPGTAKLTITGDGSYYGTISLTFEVKAANTPSQDPKPSDSKPSNSDTLKPGTVKTDSKTKNVYKVKTATTVELKQVKNKNAATQTIPSTVKLGGKTYRVTSIAANVFKNNRKLKRVTISGYVTTIGAGAFQGCSALTTVKMGNRVTTIGSKAFYNCKKLTTVTLGKNVKTIGTLSFANCVSLRKLTLPVNVAKIGTKAFCNDVKMVSFTIQSQKLTSKTIGSKAFTNMGKNNYKKLVVKVPKNKVSSYKKLLLGKGVSAKAKIKK